MKSASFIIASFLLLICSCSRSKNQSQVDNIAVSNEIKVALAALSDSIRSEGIPGWIPFLDNSSEFKWVSLGSTVPYDSLVARLRSAGHLFSSTTISWDSLHIQPLTQNEATLLAIFIDSTVSTDGDVAVQWSEIHANFRRVNGSWKIHSFEISEYDRWQKYQKLAFPDTSERLHQRIDSLVKASLGRKYNAGFVLDVDDRTANAPYRVYQMLGFIFVDPYHQLQHSYIVPIDCRDEKTNEQLLYGSVAIIRDNKIVWRSKPLIPNVSTAFLPGFADVNNDGITDILITTSADMRGYSDELWIISPDSAGGRLLNTVDENDESIIIGAQNTFKFTIPAPNAPMIIKADEVDEQTEILVYKWNGSVFVKAGTTRSKNKN